jgi:enterochelin esterase-like enzyme
VEDRSELTADIRNLDYLPEFFEPHARFNQHLTFAAEEAVWFAQARYGVSTDRADLAVYGRSSGGGFAYHAGLRRPDVFSHAIVHSPGATVPRDPPAAGEAAAQFHIAAGRYEPGFLSSARLAQAALTEQGYGSSLLELSAGHTQEITDATLIDTLIEIFPGAAAP